MCSASRAAGSAGKTDTAWATEMKCFFQSWRCYAPKQSCGTDFFHISSSCMPSILFLHPSSAICPFVSLPSWWPWHAARVLRRVPPPFRFVQGKQGAGSESQHELKQYLNKGKKKTRWLLLVPLEPCASCEPPTPKWLFQLLGAQIATMEWSGDQRVTAEAKRWRWFLACIWLVSFHCLLELKAQREV